MNKKLSLLAFVIVMGLLFSGCKKHKAPFIVPANCLVAENRFAEMMCFDAKKGNNITDAIEAIKHDRSWSSYPSLNYQLELLKNVRNNKGELLSEKFYTVLFIDPQTKLMAGSLSDVVSESGNHYYIEWGED